VVGKWWAEGREHAGGTDPLDPRALRRWVPAGPHGVGLRDGPSEARGLVASRKLCEPPDRNRTSITERATKAKLHAKSSATRKAKKIHF